ncbi:hypothetical protein SEPCBS119000_006587 [Sporothrix epigloea]|uniref:Myb/SANT-like domain-containing protein n=1 Tax=Sporothrix epigloea TaxID=1892477 RepID=A0ABP0E3R6_9PEZI
MTADVMSLFAHYKVQGMVNSKKAKDWDAIFELVCEDAQRKWPFYSWTPRVIKNKFNTEKRRFRDWTTFVTKSGVSYNEEKRLPETDNEKLWSDFFEQNKKNGRGVEWVKDTPLGDVAVYQEVFSEESATGEEIESVREMAKATKATVAPKESDSPALPATRRLKRKLPCHRNPDVNQSLPASKADLMLPEMSDETPSTQSGKLKRGENLASQTESLLQSLKELKKMEVSSVSETVEAALADLCKNWHGKLSDVDLVVCTPSTYFMYLQ